MAKEYAYKFYHSKAWKDCKRSFISERIAVGYIVHHRTHITPENISNPYITLNHSNLEYVCKDCHDRFEGHGVNNKRRGLLVMFNENGQPIAKL